ncbi:2-succinyl-6-hydroxy-2,4-cyclohexadiene-1-carboxylate synthase [Pelagibaculum spongiae]|uniref:Putative 2-succinyl-6-hydroxy-2,4-cyclohexadiene-1-carboxylate synthase n=1 Tax=Pelagibaculum spongiae TaxID=2080658 RepID=A0A2V1GSH5_9GAMM|nr:2-succinyl-6-hydroxy-2,4-cyclohexadiene-1-carboxylate synthase [Pelagibaculum spongiae]PVZ68242.1 2-succinyl-6-hydroxy-2,4-cyclohexadiene-1-carboxylate synthase [Pelagibaculum spongiae]
MAVASELSGESLNYLCVGSNNKPALIFLHGFLGSHADWISIAQSLADDFYCVLVDLPGHGKSDSIASDFSIFPQQLLQVIDQLSIKQFSLVGYSLGGRLSMVLIDYLKQNNQLTRLQGLLIESARYGLIDAQQKQERIIHDQKWAKKIIDQNIELFLSQWYTQPVFAYLSERKRHKLQMKRANNQSPSALAQALNNFSLGLQTNYIKLLTNMICPVIYLHGANDQKFSQLATELANQKYESNCTAIEIRSVVDCGHNVHLDNPQALIDAVYALHK